jgi:hypothetical protein
MCVEIEEREQDARRLLHAEHTPERPFAIILEGGVSIALPCIGMRVHTFVFAYVRTCPSGDEGQPILRRRTCADVALQLQNALLELDGSIPNRGICGRYEAGEGQRGQEQTPRETHVVEDVQKVAPEMTSTQTQRA